MKIIISSANAQIIPRDCTQVYTKTGLALIILSNQDEDIEGFILPCAKQNPEFIEILKIIHEHKKRLYDKFGRGVLRNNRIYPAHHFFTKILEQNNIFI